MAIDINEAKERVQTWADFFKEDRAELKNYPECDRECDEVLAFLDSHARMLDFLKREYGDREHVGTGLSGRLDVWDLIHDIDPEWKSPWNDPYEPEGRGES